MKNFYRLNLPAKTLKKAGPYKMLIIGFVLSFAVLGNGYGQTSNFKKPDEVNFNDKKAAIDYKQFLENQKIPFLESNGEVFILDGIAWERSYNEKEYVLTPTMQDISQYKKRIHQLDNENNGIIKSNFHFINVEVSEKSLKLLKSMNINVPDYVQNNVNVYLPEIDIDLLNGRGINYTLLNNYGKTTDTLIIRNRNNRSLLWSEGWEGSLSPYDRYTSTSLWGSSTNYCYWGDESCSPHSGYWCLWCADDGADAPTTDCSSYINYMDAVVEKLSAINISCYTNFIFSYWLKINTPSGSVDKLQLWLSLDGGTWILVDEYPNDILTWQQQTVSIAGGHSSLNFSFIFSSNWTGTSDGAYLDDLQLTGDYDCSSCGPTANATTISHTSCGLNNGSVTASGGVSYHWSNGSNSQTINNLTPGTYTVTVTDANGCTGTASTSVNSSSGVNATATTTSHTTCGLNNGSATASGGVSYHWSNGSNSQTINNLAPGTYTVTVTDANGCTGTASTTVNGSSGANATATTTSHTSCGLNNGSATASGGVSYHWSNGSNSQTINNLSSGTYTVTVTDANGCTGTASTTVNSSSGANATATTTQNNTLCGGCNGIVTASGGVSYSWSGGLGSGASHSGVCAGIYTVTITDANGCTDIDNTTVNNDNSGPTSLNTSLTSSDDGSCNGSVTVSSVVGGTPPYSYLWNDTAAQTTATATGLCAGTYSVTVTDNNYCSITGSVVIHVSAIEEISFINSLSIFPNPTSKAFTITMDITKAKTMELKLLDITGKLLQQEEINVKPGTFTKTIDMSRYAKGIYTLQLISDEGIINRKIVLK